MTAVHDATQNQIKAAMPGVSTWLSANAGSGKTRVLTDRVARLLLQGVSPQNILCLTYTKAAASEMQNRLFQRLGTWTMLPDDALRRELLTLGLDPSDIPENLLRPRTLFATAIETPGGLKIQTIHSFCATLLRQFPLEAGVSPQFREMEDRDQKMLMQTVLDAMLSTTNGQRAFAGVAQEILTGDVHSFLRSIVNNAALFANDFAKDDIWASLGLQPGTDQADIYSTCFTSTDHALLQQLISDLNTHPKEAKNAEKFANLPLTMDQATYAALVDIVIYKTGAKAGQAKIGAFPNKDLRGAIPYLPALEALMRRVETTKDRLLTVQLAQRTYALHQFAQPFLQAYTAEKSRLGRLDFNDLISRTITLLNRPDVAAWVLYRLDGGIDHILVDEAQDTSPDQWQVITALTQEMTAGQGAQDKERTIFVVGDKKQSIYSFQGADPLGFDRMRQAFTEKLQALGRALQDHALKYSFRSADEVLKVVDKTFDLSNGLGGASQHMAFKSDMPGRVDVWDFIESQKENDKGHWADPVDLKSEDHHDKILARSLARHMVDMLDTGTLPEPQGDTYVQRPIEPRDILILVRSRQAALFGELHQACKSAGLPVSGYDRLDIGEELAVKDICALLAFLVTPEDDYALACALKSPLFGWSEQDLFTLAAGPRSKFLWRALDQREPDFPQTVQTLRGLRQKSEFLRPYEMIEYILSDLQGRQKLIGRLGRAAEEGIDALITLALDYETDHTPSLTGFLVWMMADELKIKRQLDGAHNEIRIMTIHGAKGLEAPIVILPQTNKQKNPNQETVLPDAQGRALWMPPRDDIPSGQKPLDAAATAKQIEERDRLLYVAMTRAEQWLIVAGAGTVTKNDDKQDYWYKSVRSAVDALGAATVNAPTWQGLRYQPRPWDHFEHHTPSAPSQKPTTFTIATGPVDPPPKAKDPINPSDLPGPKTMAGEYAGAPDALDFGITVHRYLEILPTLPPEDWDRVQKTIGTPTAYTEARDVITAPHLTHIFAPTTLAEVAVMGTLPDGRPVSGLMDRLIVTATDVLLVDYKTNRVVPPTAVDIPAGLLAQMALYHQALAPLYPNHRVQAAILWTKTKMLMPIVDDILQSYVIK
ncbi:MAG: double-strand break repair helicase AddA [Pseudomonadota bacterium]